MLKTHVQWLGQKLKRLDNKQDVECRYVGMLRWGSTSWTKSKWKGGQLVLQQQQEG